MTINANVAYVFPGQGSQQIGMLADVAADWPVVLETFAEASEVLGYDLWQLVQQGAQEDLNLTENAQPALLASSVAIWRVLQESGAVRPSVIAGHSLGEWSALVCADVVAFADAIRLVRLRGRYMQEAVPVGVGAMAAVIGLADEVVEKCCAAAAVDAVVNAVNYNSPGQVVIAGHAAAVEKAIELCKGARAKMAVLLPVSAPFHTKLMLPAAERLMAEIANTQFFAPVIPVVHNVNAQTEQDPEKIKALMVEQIYSPVAWVACVNALATMGVTQVLECGPGKVLIGMVKRINKTLGINATDSAQAIKQFLQKP